jgi:pyrrolysyl-tRNA synthetase-like protein
MERILPGSTQKKVYYRKQVSLFPLIEKMKLWPSRQGILHGIKTFGVKGSYAYLTTHCNRGMLVRNSKRSRAARWLRNKWFFRACEECSIPQWKLEKYASTVFKRGWGSYLLDGEGDGKSTKQGR